tara:strand:+ start:402 stop:632 length:231 start_codon:yes stop_codon:yes gene_type:complete
MITMETVSSTNHRKVLQGRRVIGFVNYFPAIASIGRKEGWTFLPNKNDIDARYPTPSPVFDDPKAVLRHVQRILAP